MDSFTLHAIGNLAADPELGQKGDVVYTRFRLIGNDYAGRDSQGNSKEIISGQWFVVFGNRAQAIADYCHKGDQLILTAAVQDEKWTDKEGNTRYGKRNIVRDFKFGRKGRGGVARAETTEGEDRDDDRQTSSSTAGHTNDPYAEYAGTAAGAGNFDDDIPF